MTNFTTTGVALHQWPRTLKPTEVTLHLGYNTSTFTSPFTRTTQTVSLPGAMHELAFNMPALKQDQQRDARAFVATLRGQAGRFIFPVYGTCRYAPPAMYSAERVTVIPLTADITTITADTTLVTADATHTQYETTFTATSCPDSVTIIGTLWLNSNRAPLQVGGWISWDDATGWRHLHIITDMAHDVESGDCTLTVEPPMRALPTPATPMHVHSPSGVFRLTGDGEGALRQAGPFASATINAIQAFPLQVTVL